MLRFHGDAIVLSGLTGTKLKSQIIGDYYPLWWNITSGEPAHQYSYKTSIIDFNAGTGENFIEDTQETILGSAGHALNLKAQENTSELTILLAEQDTQCFQHLENVIGKRWPNLGTYGLANGVNLMSGNLQNALKNAQRCAKGNSLFLFDPLLYTPWEDIERVASNRIHQYYQTGTEFIIFLFTTDWFHGRGDLCGLPENDKESSWNQEQRRAVLEADNLFGHKNWRIQLLQPFPYEDRSQILVNLYRAQLHTWFRYVLPLPFVPKDGQMYHLFMCSNYERGIGITRQFYRQATNNPAYSPSNSVAYEKFLTLHPEMKPEKRNVKPTEWKILWAIIKDHDQGLADIYCRDLSEKVDVEKIRKASLAWLSMKGYLIKIPTLTKFWKKPPDLYQLNWESLQENLSIQAPPSLEPLRLVPYKTQP